MKSAGLCDPEGCDDLLADVIASYIRYAVDHLKGLTAEIDGWYADGVNGESSGGGQVN